MKTLTLLMLVASTFTLSSCSKFKTGKYVTREITSDDINFKQLLPCSGNSHFIELKNRLLNRHYQIIFKDDYATMKDSQDANEIMLAKHQDELGDYFITTIDKGMGKEKIELQIRSDSASGLIYIVTILGMTNNVTNYIPAQIGGKINQEFCQAKAFCYLSKSE